MTSLKGRIFNFALRNGHLFRGKFKKEKFTLNTSIIEFRQLCERGVQKHSNILNEVTVQEQIIKNIKSEWLIPESANSEKLILYVHGGGYVSGSCTDHRRFVSRFAKITGITNLIYEYRLAPEYPFPAALDDSLEIYEWLLLSGFEPKNIVIAGESAGGGLTLAILLALKERNIPQPKAAVIF
jgi:acetyl esterase/lipase